VKIVIIEVQLYCILFVCFFIDVKNTVPPHWWNSRPVQHTNREIYYLRIEVLPRISSSVLIELLSVRVLHGRSYKWLYKLMPPFGLPDLRSIFRSARQPPCSIYLALKLSNKLLIFKSWFDSTGIEPQSHVLMVSALPWLPVGRDHIWKVDFKHTIGCVLIMGVIKACDWHDSFEFEISSKHVPNNISTNFLMVCVSKFCQIKWVLVYFIYYLVISLKIFLYKYILRSLRMRLEENNYRNTQTKIMNNTRK